MKALDTTTSRASHMSLYEAKRGCCRNPHRGKPHWHDDAPWREAKPWRGSHAAKKASARAERRQTRMELRCL